MQNVKKANTNDEMFPANMSQSEAALKMMIAYRDKINEAIKVAYGVLNQQSKGGSHE